MNFEPHMFTVWRFRGVTIPQEVVAVRPSEPFEPQHEYQTILWRGLAWGREDAKRRWKVGEGEAKT